MSNINRNIQDNMLYVSRFKTVAKSGTSITRSLILYNIYKTIQDDTIECNIFKTIQVECCSRQAWLAVPARHVPLLQVCPLTSKKSKPLPPPRASNRGSLPFNLQSLLLTSKRLSLGPPLCHLPPQKKQNSKVFLLSTSKNCAFPSNITSPDIT